MLLPLHAHLKDGRELRRTKEATWALSNITAGTVEQIQRVVDEGFLHTLVHLIQEVRKEREREREREREKERENAPPSPLF